ncbi:hypothetical protein Ae406Ps2_6430c [Pseudonocardia sp. Ae406_Ps2]|nr:hypothetical protein Ae406Ps2_6430c [Pseudonocardia sp. Ae406_Ps2]
MRKTPGARPSADFPHLMSEIGTANVASYSVLTSPPGGSPSRDAFSTSRTGSGSPQRHHSPSRRLPFLDIGRLKAGQVQSRVDIVDRVATPLAAPLTGSDQHSILGRFEGGHHASAAGTEPFVGVAVGVRLVVPGPARRPEAEAGRCPALPGAGHGRRRRGGVR